MATYINRDTLIEAIKAQFEGRPISEMDKMWNAALSCAIGQVESEPSADVEEVVRCKDCAWCHAGYCEKYDDLIPFGCANKQWEDWFCADGKR